MRRSLLLFSALLVGACDGMVADSTIVDDLRILNIVSEPASPAPGEVPELDVLVADPGGTDFQLWSWWCVETVCGEGALPTDVPSSAEGGFATVSALACEPGVCDGPGERSDPDSWLSELGFGGFSFARRTIGISPAPEVRLNDNPGLLPVGLPDAVPAGQVSELNFQIDDALVDEPNAYGFASAGGFLEAEVGLNEEGVFQLELSAPEEAGEVTVWVVVDDGLGGSASWTGSLVVE